ncbi:MAG: TraU family protein, partial [Candidatus Omnitrophica bacterium]|nr:TraU family protein [Candidatus Omnitrophota bacterium]
LSFSPDFMVAKLQLAYPVVSGCVKIGDNPMLWESGLTSFNGKYLWIYWRKRECCIL